MASTKIRLTASQGGLDPYTHYWYRVGQRSYRRVCDDVDWQGGGSRYERPPNIDCSDCSILLHTDRQYGRRKFTLTRVPKGYMTPRPGDVLYNEADQFRTQTGAMEPLRLWEFTTYRLANDPVRERMVLEYLGVDRRTGGGPDPWVPLRDAFVKLDGTVESLRSRPPRPDPRFRDGYADAYTAVTRTMIAYCDTYRIKPYGVGPVQVEVGGASVRVTAEFWMETVSGNGTVSLWLKGSMPPSSQAAVSGFLLDEARRTVAFWDGRFPYLWAIRKEEAPQQGSPSDAERDSCRQAGEDFMARCLRLRQQKCLPMPSDGDGGEE